MLNLPTTVGTRAMHREKLGTVYLPNNMTYANCLLHPQKLPAHTLDRQAYLLAQLFNRTHRVFHMEITPKENRFTSFLPILHKHKCKQE